MEAKIEKEWQALGFANANKVHQALKKKGEKITLKQVKAFLENREEVQVLKNVVKPKEFSTINAPRPMFSTQSDFMIFNRREYKGYQYILGVIDVYSRKAFCVATKTRETGEMIEAFKTIFKKFGKYPENINVDNEFDNNEFKKLMAEHGTKIWFSYADEGFIDAKNSLIERFWATLAKGISKYIRATKKKDWVNWLDNVVDAYNNTIHSTTGQTPNDLFDNKASSKQEPKFIENKLNVGDYVRIITKKKGFGAKGDQQTFSDEIYQIVRADEERKNRWVLENIETKKEAKRPYLERDLSLVNNPTLLQKPKVAQTRKKTEDDKTEKKVKARRETKKALKELESINLVNTAPARAKRERKAVKKLDL